MMYYLTNASVLPSSSLWNSFIVGEIIVGEVIVTSSVLTFLVNGGHDSHGMNAGIFSHIWRWGR